MANLNDNAKLTRFKDASWVGNDEECIIGGAGGISSWLAFLLARANFLPMVYDFDKLEEHNLGGQLFPSSGINKPKVDVLSEVIFKFSGKTIWTFNEKYDKNSMIGKFMFSGFDNMKARQDMFNNFLDAIKSFPAEECVFIDGRLLAEQLQIFCIVGSDTESIEKYKAEYLFADEEVQDAPCTMKQTSHAAAMIASLMTGFFTNHVHNIRTKSKTRFVPFKTEYFIPLGLMSY